jgi:hypothetical protein
MNKILRMLKGKFKFIDKLCSQQFLVFLNLLYLNSRELSNFREVVSVYNLHIIDSSVMISDHNLCEFKVSKSLIQILLKLIHLSLALFFSSLFLCIIALVLFKFLLHLLRCWLQSLLLEGYFELVPHFLISLFQFLSKFCLQTLDFFFWWSLKLLVRIAHSLVVLL